MELTHNDLEKRVTNAEENMFKGKEDLTKIQDYQIDTNNVNDSLTDIRNKLTDLEGRWKGNNIRIDGIPVHQGETWEECERRIQRLLSEELDINNEVIELAHRVKAYISEKKSSKKLKLRPVVCNLLSFADKARTLKNSHRLKGTPYYVNKDFSREILAYWKELWEKVKALRKEGKIAYLNYKSLSGKQ